jgi:uncharacterized membrane protein YedE/YeeE
VNAVPDRPAVDRWVVIASLLGLLLGAALLLSAFSGREAALLLLGAVLGLALYHAAFGFASSWRRFLFAGEGAGIRAQMLMLAVASAFFLPILADGSFFGRPVVGAVAPVGVSVLIGAALFGVGMQLAGGCASGTLYSLGGGSLGMAVTLVFFMAGSVIGTAHLPWWLEAPSLGSISIGKAFGWGWALAVQLAVLAIIWGAVLWIERRFGTTATSTSGRNPTAPWSRRLLRGPWPLYLGGVALALLNVLTLALAGHPWTVSFGYTLWGAKLAAIGGVDLASWPFWTWSFPKNALAGSVFENSTSLMNFGIIAGAMLAAGLAGRFRPKLAVSWRPVLAAALGGLAMGYGARLAFGCNIGAYFSGVASGSLHGWLWLVAALAGSYVGGRLRPLFRLPLL